MPDQQPPQDLTIGPTHARSFSINVPFLANQVDVNEAIRSLQASVVALQEQIAELQRRVNGLS